MPNFEKTVEHWSAWQAMAAPQILSEREKTSRPCWQVHLNHHCSYKWSPQGSLLGPLLVLILIKDIPEVCENNEILLSADDAKMLKSSSQALFQLDVDSLVEWCSDNSIVLKATKCCVLSIGRRGSPENTMILCASVQWAAKQKDLGIIVDEKLSWDAHISEKLSKALKTFYPIRRNCCVRSPQAKTAMYKSIILPVVAFGSLAP